MKLAVKNSSYVANSGDALACDTSAGSFTVFLPPSPDDGDAVEIVDAAKTWGTHSLTVDGNGKTMVSGAVSIGETLVCDISDPARLLLIWRAAVSQWEVFGS